MSGMRCQRCQRESPTGANFCAQCGARLAPAGAPGAPPQLSAARHLIETSLSSQSALEGERKQITVLFADLKSSMELIADLDPEEAHKLLDPVLERMIESVQRYEGTIIDIAGDGIQALFGAPFAHEDHGIRGCYAGLRMQESVKRYAQEIQRTHGAPIQIRVGLNSGEALVCVTGTEVRRAYIAVGRTVHLAARMEQAAIPGSILISSSTLCLAEGYVQVKSLGKLNVKGLSEPVEAYEVTGAQGVRTRLQVAATRGLMRFVGRDAEIAQLGAAWQRAAAGRGQIVAVGGEPGVGKSRLIYEFVRSRSREPWLIIESGSVAHGQATAHLPIIELLKSYFKIHDGDDHGAIREKVTKRLVALDESLKTCIPALLALLDTPSGDSEWEKLDPQLRREKTHEAVKRLLLRSSQVQPLLVVLEDLHGIDSETQAILNNLVNSLPLARMLLLVSYRPEYRHDWQAKPYYTQVRLGPLEADGTENLLDALLGRDAMLLPLKRLLAERTAGNPFFLEESVRSLAESKALIGAPGAYRFAGSLTTIQVPTTVQPVIAERIDRLSPLHKQLLQAAAVIGTSVPSSLLHAIVEQPDETLRQGLAHLQSADYLHEAGLFPDPEYTFKHALIHEVAYQSLLHERRRGLHARIVEAIERLHWDRILEHVEQLSHHALRGEVWDKAVSYSYQAGAKAAAKSAHREAVARFTEALTAIERVPQSGTVMQQAFDLRFSLRTSLSPLGDFQRSFELLHEAEAIARTLNDQARLARVFTFKALYFWSVGQQDQAIEASEQALLAAQPVGEAPAQVLAKLFAGRARHARGDYVQAIELMNWVISATDGDRTNFLGMANLPSVSARTWLAWSLAERGEFGLALERGDEGVYIAEAVDHLVSRIYAYMALGIVHLRKGNLDLAIQSLERAYQMSERADLRMARAMVAGYLGRAYTLSNQAGRAIEILKQAVEAAAAMRLMVDQAMRLVHLSDAYLHIDDLEQAISVAQAALQNSLDYDQRGATAWAQWLLGEINTRADKLSEAESHYRNAMMLASELGMAPLLAHSHFSLGKGYSPASGNEHSREHLVAAAGLYRSLEMPSWIREVEMRLGRLQVSLST
jgi:class 3 adenylate cyclase/tetratricopeptide (TPR) repeat protein